MPEVGSSCLDHLVDHLRDDLWRSLATSSDLTSISKVVPAPGLEPGTLGLRVPCSNQLSHAGRGQSLLRIVDGTARGRQQLSYWDKETEAEHRALPRVAFHRKTSTMGPDDAVNHGKA